MAAFKGEWVFDLEITGDQRRLWAMRDPIGATGIEITEVIDGNGRSVSVAVG